MGKRAPSAPDPVRTAAAQTGSNFTTAVANGILGQVNQNTPFGSLTYSTTGYESVTDPSTGQTYQVPIRTATQSYTPGGQRIVDATMQTQENLANLGRDQSGRLGSLLSRPMDLSGLPGPATRIGGQTAQQTSFDSAGGMRRDYSTTGGNSREAVEQALMSRMQGGLDRDRKALEQRLADQGIQYGTQAWQAAMSDHGQQVNDARMSAVLAGGQEQSRMVGLERDRAEFQNQAQQQAYQQLAGRAAFGNAARSQQFAQNQQAASFQNQARQQALQERYAQRNQPLNEIAALMSGSQVQSPNFMNISGPQMANTDYAGIVNSGYQNQLAQWQANQSMMGGFMGGVGSLLAAPTNSILGGIMLGR